MLLIPMGMVAKKKVTKPEIPQLQNFPSSTLSEYRLHAGEAVFRGKLINFPKEVMDASEEEKKEAFKMLADILNSKGITMYIRDAVLNTEKVRAITFNDDCTFDMKIQLPHPMFVNLAPIRNIFMCPGDTIDFVINLTAKNKEETRIIQATGLSGEVNRIVEEVDKKYTKFDQSSTFRLENVNQMDSLMEWRNQQLARLDSMVIKMNAGLPELQGCSPLASDIVRSYILFQYGERIIRSGDTDFVQNDLDSEKTEAFMRRYFDFIAPREKYLFNNPMMMIAAEDGYVNDTHFCMFFQPIFAGATTYYPYMYWPEMASEEENLTTKRTKIANGIKKVSEMYNISTNSLMLQTCLMRNVFYEQKGYKCDYDIFAEDVAAIIPYITDPDLARFTTIAYRERVKKGEASVAEDKLLTKGDSIFHRIISPYKGNVLSIDFWAMSCGPCRAGMLEDREMVERLKDQPIKFIYLTNDDPEKCNKWMEENNIKGEHVFISRKEWSHLKEKFSFNGIPFHVYVDKQGKIRDIEQSVEELLNE